MTPPIPNRSARRLFMQRHLLSHPPTGRQTKDDLLNVIDRLGFVQVDSIQTVERAHHMILFARNQTYQRRHLTALLEKDRTLFENWTHDASMIPTAFYPYWQRRFERDGERLRARWRKIRREGFDAMLAEILDHIEREGPAMSRTFAREEKKGSDGWWDWHPSKTALEYLWRSGQLSVDRRINFQKVYDLTERVIPQLVRAHEPSEAESIEWLNDAALDRLGFATSGQIAAFWDHVSPKEAAAWCRAQMAKGKLEEVLIDGADGTTKRHFARAGLIEEAAALAPPTARLRILSPFDPAIRDRKRAEFLFGFHYRIEIFVPEPKRQYGYYVFPILEGDNLIGRIDMRTRRDDDVLAIKRIWLEPGVKFTKGRRARLVAELARMARFSSVAQVEFAAGWLG